MNQLLSAASIIFVILSCQAKNSEQTSKAPIQPNAVDTSIVLGAEQLDAYLPLIGERPVALVVNQTSLINDSHLVDTLLGLGIKIKKVFAPEHGFRGEAGAGELIQDGKDLKTGLPIVSLYGKQKKPTSSHLEDVEVVIFDIQDVGTRFYTYISTMHYVMEACAENKKEVMVLDRPNPNGAFVDGPIREEHLKSFVGMHPIPILHGLTVGEMAKMINGEQWLENKDECLLTVIPLKNYHHNKPYALPVRPSPNLPNDLAVQLYPSLCLFEGTVMSVGRGTLFPFQVLGYPDPSYGSFTFTPKSIEGMSVNPKHKEKQCYGIDFRDSQGPIGLSLSHLLDFYQQYGNKEAFFTSSFDRLAGTEALKKQILAGLDETQIRQSWEPGLGEFKTLRKKYLLYPDN